MLLKIIGGIGRIGLLFAYISLLFIAYMLCAFHIGIFPSHCKPFWVPSVEKQNTNNNLELWSVVLYEKNWQTTVCDQSAN